MSLPFIADLDEFFEDSTSYYTDEELAESPRDRKARLAATGSDKPAPAKGQCSKCGRHVGKGVHFHEQACTA